MARLSADDGEDTMGVTEPRIALLDVAAVEIQMNDLDAEVKKFVGGLDPRYAAAYTARGHMRFAMGACVQDVLDDFWMSARCLAAEPGMHMSRHSPEQLMTRRMLPVEMGLLGGQVDLARRLAAGFGLPILVGRAGMADPQTERELRILSPGLMGEALRHPQHLLGLAAAVYAGTLAAAVRGYADEVKMGLRILADAHFEAELTGAQRGVIFRYSGLCEVILELVQPGQRHLTKLLAEQIEAYTAQLRRSSGASFTRPASPLKYIDTSSMALLALAALAGYPLGDFPPEPEETPHAKVYADFVDAMVAGNQRAAVEADKKEELDESSD